MILFLFNVVDNDDEEEADADDDVYASCSMIKYPSSISFWKAGKKLMLTVIDELGGMMIMLLVLESEE